MNDGAITNDTANSGFPSTLELPRRLALTEDVYEKLKSLIMDLQVQPGSRINMDALARQLGVSITPIRESLSRLESDGLVVKLSMRGYAATPVLTRQEFEDLYALRLLLEPWAACEAATRATSNEIEALEAEHRSASPVPEFRSYQLYRSFASHDVRLHEMILEIAGNEMVASAVARSHPHLHLFRLDYVRKGGAESVAEHQTIFDAIKRGDGTGASDAMAVHLRMARDRFRAAFSPERPADSPEVESHPELP
jgi:DNA-binding GntR family transcriptional regulator